MKKTHAAVTQGGSTMSRYQQVIIGNRSFLPALYYEFCIWLAWIPGAVGLFLRKAFWPRLFGSCGKGVVFGSNIVLRHPGRIHLGNRVVISEGCILDARNEYMKEVISVGDDVILSNNVMISCKKGAVKIGARSGINAQTIIHSTQGNPVYVGSDAIIGPRCYIVGGGSYHTNRLDIPIWRQGIKNDGGVRLENDVWLGANVTVLGGVTMGTGAIAAAGAVFTRSVPERAVCMGIPASIVKMRSEVPKKDTSSPMV